jgi:hypothetical protein
MAQTRRVEKRNRRADRPRAPRFSPYRTMFPSLRDCLFCFYFDAHGRLPDRYRRGRWHAFGNSAWTRAFGAVLLLSTSPEPDTVLPPVPDNGFFFLSARLTAPSTKLTHVVQAQLGQWSRSRGGPSDRETRHPNTRVLLLSFSAER